MPAQNDDLMLPGDLSWCPGGSGGARAACGATGPELGHYYGPGEGNEADDERIREAYTVAGLTPGTRPCNNEREPDGEPCPGTVTFEAGDLQARCSVCESWMGRLAPEHEKTVTPTAPNPPAVNDD